MALREHSHHGSVRVTEEGYQYSPPGRPTEDVRGDRSKLSIVEDHREDAPDQIAQAQQLSERGDLDEAWSIVDRALNVNPDDVAALICATQIYWKSEENSVAYQFAKRACELSPKNPYCWGNLGQIEDQLYRFEEAERCYERGISVARNDAQKGFLYLNYAGMLVNKGDWGRALSVAKKAIAYRPDKPKAKANLGLALLALGQWKEAWPLYDSIIGFDKSRRKMQYAGEQEWDGSPGKSIVVYEEQGIGDAMSFASMIPDVIKDCESVVIDCSPKLRGLFQRSFPSTTVYGSITGLGEDWRANHKIDASISLGGLGKLYRPTPESCPGTPYLVADPERVTMWRALFKGFGKPVIGIGWSGGLEHTGARNRVWKLEELLPLFRSIDAVWVSLQYKDSSKEIETFRAKFGIDLRQYQNGTLTPDYDDTAAMVTALDLVVTMQSAVLHLAGALGKECCGFVNRHSQWRYGPNTQTTLPWYRSVKLFRNINGWPIEEAAKELKERYGFDLAA